LTLEEVEQKLVEIQAGAKKREAALGGAVMKATIKKNIDTKLEKIIKIKLQE